MVAGVLTGVLVNVLTPPAQRLTGSAGPTVTLAPLSVVPKATSASKRHRKPKPSPSPTPTAPPLSVASEDPLNMDDLGVWTFPNKIPFDSSQLAHANALFHTSITGMASYFYSLGGYAINADTQLVLQNDSSQPVSILDMRVIKNCGAPLNGTLFYSPNAGADDDVRLGFNLDSADTDAESAKGWDPHAWKPDYFESKHISFRPGEQRVLNIRAITAKHACTFNYQATVLEGKAKFYQTFDDAGQPFRVSALMNKLLPYVNVNFARYAALYIGGVAAPTGDSNDDYVKVKPKSYHS